MAYYGLKLYSDAVEAYKKALELEPDDKALQQAVQKVGALRSGRTPPDRGSV